MLIPFALPTLALLASLSAQETTTEPRPGVHFVPTMNSVVEVMLDMAEVTSEDVVYDLGSGDGRIVITAAQRYGARGVGVELDPELVERARANALEAGVADKVTFVQADLFTIDVSEATVVTMYLLASMHARMQPKLLRELAPGSRIVTHRFPMGEGEPDQKKRVSGRDVYLYRVPAGNAR